MANIKNYGLIGLGSDVQFGKNGGRLIFTGTEFRVTTVNGSTLADFEANTVSFGSLTDGAITITGFVDEANMVSNSNTLIPTQQSVKSYIDSQLSVSGSSLNIAADSGSGAVVFADDTLTINGTANQIVTSFNDTSDILTVSLSSELSVSNVTSSGTIEFNSLSDGVISVTGFVDEDDMLSNSNTLVPTQQSVKAYVDSKVAPTELNFQADAGGVSNVDIGSQTFVVAGGTNITTTGSGQTVTIALDSTLTGLSNVTATNFIGALDGNAGTATVLQTTRTFSASGDATATAQNFNGSQNVVLPLVLANSGVTASTYGSATEIPVLTIDAKGRVTVASTASISTSFSIAADVGNVDVVNTGETLTFSGTAGQLETVVTNNTITFGIVDGATLSNLSVVGTFNSDNITASDITVDGDTTITGNLTVQGSQIIVESTVTRYSDPAIYLQSDTIVSDTGLDVGIHFNYWDGTAQEGFFGWDQSTKKYTFLTNATESPDNVFSGITGTIVANLEGNVAATNVTASGTVSFGTLVDTGESISVTKFVDAADGLINNNNDTSIPTSAAVIDYIENNAGDGLLLRSTFSANSTDSSLTIGTMPNVSTRTYYADKVVLKVNTAFSGGSFNHIIVRDNNGAGNVLVTADDADGSTTGTYLIELGGDIVLTKNQPIVLYFRQSDGTTPAVVTAGSIVASVHYNWV